MNIQRLEQAGLLAVQQLRKKNHSKGHPFMINTPSLPIGQCYLEFPDGTIQLVRINRSKKDFEAVRELSFEEQLLIREKFVIDKLLI